jgi:hypothetical protein
MADHNRILSKIAFSPLIQMWPKVTSFGARITVREIRAAFAWDARPTNALHPATFAMQTNA